MSAKKIQGIPPQECGNYHDTESYKTYKDAETATAAFEVLKQRLVDVNHWHEIGQRFTAHFKVFDINGYEVNRTIAEGDFVRINLPAPGNPDHDGYDWVRVLKIQNIQTDEEDCWIVQLTPSINPTCNKTGEIAHFYKEGATANVFISKNGLTLKAAVYGRNEKVNHSNNGLLEEVRNTVITIAGQLGISKIHWKALAEGLLNFD